MDSGLVILIIVCAIILFFGFSTFGGSVNQEGGGIFGKKKAGNLGIMGLLVILIGSLMFSDCVN